MARYVPKHRRRRPPRHRAYISAASLVVAAASAVSGAAGFVPAVQAQNPVVIERAANARASTGRSVAPSVDARPGPSAVAPAIDPKTARVPEFIDLPSIDKTSSLVQLGLNPDGSLEVPVDFGQAGWYSGGPAPGEKGPAVIAGHVDSYRGPAVFADLNKLKPDDIVRIARVDGTKVRFRVTRIDRYPKDYFPTDQVYGPTEKPELRLITCGGTFNPSTGSYRDNTVVYAELIAN